MFSDFVYWFLLVASCFLSIIGCIIIALFGYQLIDILTMSVLIALGIAAADKAERYIS